MTDDRQFGVTAAANAVAQPVRSVARDQGVARAGTPHVSRIEAPYRPIIELDGEYSRLPIREGFNWHAAFAAIDEGEWYLVVFRSKHRADADDAYLTWLDERASGAASQYPGFMYYFIGTPPLRRTLPLVLPLAVAVGRGHRRRGS